MSSTSIYPGVWVSIYDRLFNLPEQVLDLDYTLVLHRENGAARPAAGGQGDILPRAGLTEFLVAVAPLFQLHVFTQAVPHLAGEYVKFLNDMHEKAGGGAAATPPMIAGENVHVASRTTDAVGGVRRELVACKGLDSLHGSVQLAAEGQGGVSGSDDAAAARALTMILDDQFDGPDPQRRAQQLRDPRFAKKAVSLGTWAAADRANIMPIRKMSTEDPAASASGTAPVPAGEPDTELPSVQAGLEHIHAKFFGRLEQLERALVGCRSVADLEQLLVNTPRPDVRDLLLERLQRLAVGGTFAPAAMPVSRPRSYD